MFKKHLKTWNHHLNILYETSFCKSREKKSLNQTSGYETSRSSSTVLDFESEWFSVKVIVLVRVYNQLFQGKIILMVTSRVNMEQDQVLPNSMNRFHSFWHLATHYTSMSLALLVDVAIQRKTAKALGQASPLELRRNAQSFSSCSSKVSFSSESSDEIHWRAACHMVIASKDASTWTGENFPKKCMISLTVLVMSEYLCSVFQRTFGVILNSS